MMRRRSFVAGALVLPLVGGVLGRYLGETGTAPPAAAPEPAEATVWEYLDHSSSWEDAAVQLRAYAADGHPDGLVMTHVADLLQRHAGRGDQANGVLGLYPATALLLASLRHMRLYASPQDHAAQVELIRELARAV